MSFQPGRAATACKTASGLTRSFSKDCMILAQRPTATQVAPCRMSEMD
jgi:hypothetical protein